MLTAHELIGFMSPALALEILEAVHNTDKPVYRGALNAVAEARKVRPIFLERKPRAERHHEMIATLSKPRLDMLSLSILQSWLLKVETPMLTGFLEALGIPHEKGTVDDLPKTMDDEKLKAAVEGLLAKHPPEKVAVYLRAFNDLNEAQWPNLAAMLDSDSRLQLGA
ncbi:MAG TPA: hypothetical protein VL527_19190 [Dongiaceae bacterium]|jgi:hypothetical protein|nr:hypothetical protein [Dongiaceae bacterium]